MIEQHNSLSEKFIKKWFWLYLFSFIIGPLWYIVKIIISTELSVSEVWILYWIISLITMIAAYNDLWFTDSLNYFIPKFITEKRYDKVKSILFYSLSVQMLTWISIALFFYFWADYIAESYFKAPQAWDVMKIFAFFFLWINIFQLISVFLIVVQNTFYHKIIDLLRIWFTLIFASSLYFFDLWNLVNYSYWWLVWLYAWTIFWIIIFYNKYYKLYLKNEKVLWDKVLLKKIFKYSMSVFIWMQAWVILSQIDMQMIIYFLWTTDAGYYTNYLSIISIPFMLIWPIFGLLFPMFSEMYSKNEIDKINQVKSIFQKNFLSLSIAFNILFFVFAEVLATILFGEKFINSWIILRYSILFLAFNFLLQMNGNILAAMWKIKERIYLVFIWVVFSFIMNYILIKTIWVNWAALASGILWVLFWIMTEYVLWKQFKISFDFKYLFKNILLLWSIWIISYFYILPIFGWLNRFESLLLFCLYSSLYFTIFAFINMKEFKFFIWEIRSLRGKKG